MLMYIIVFSFVYHVLLFCKVHSLSFVRYVLLFCVLQCFSFVIPQNAGPEILTPSKARWVSAICPLPSTGLSAALNAQQAHRTH